MSRSDHATLQNLGFDPFLCADVGTETNGSTLTMLSLLSRLGQDPWAEAARWAKLPTATAIDSLVEVISAVPQSGRTLPETRAVAARLAMLLPKQEWLPDMKATVTPSRTVFLAFGKTLRMTTQPRWLPVALLACALTIGLALNFLHPLSGGRSASARLAAPLKVQTQATSSR